MEQKSRFRSSLLLAASATLCATLLSGPASAHTETALSAFAAINQTGDLRNNGVGGGIGATIRPFRWVRLYGHAEALRGFDGDIGGLNLTRSSNLFQIKGGVSIPIAHRWSAFSSLEYFRYVGAGNALHGYTVEAGATRTFG